MINPFNVSDSKTACLRGIHRAKTIYCKSLTKHPGDVDYAWVECDFIIETDKEIDEESCYYDDRIYKGNLHIRGLYGIDEQRPTEAEEAPDIYPRSEEDSW